VAVSDQLPLEAAIVMALPV